MKKFNKLTLLTILLFAISNLSLTSLHAAEVDNIASDTTVTFDSGILSLLEAPEFDFGTQTISGDEKKYEAQNVNRAIIVSDLRGTLSGWSLVASLSAYNYGSIGTDSPTLQGAYITIENQAIAGLNGNVAAAPTQGSPVNLFSGGASVNVLSASAGAGAGKWNSSIAPQDVSLTVLPGTAKLGSSFATIKWSLQDTP